LAYTTACTTVQAVIIMQRVIIFIKNKVINIVGVIYTQHKRTVRVTGIPAGRVGSGKELKFTGRVG